MKSIRKIALVGMLAMSLMEVGCMKETRNYSVTAKDAISHLEEKYDKEFTLHGYELSDYLSTTDRVFCETEGVNLDAGEHVIVGVIEEDDGSIRFVDNYFYYIVRPQIEEYVRGFIETEFEDVKLYHNRELGCFSNELTKESTLEDLFEVKSDYIMDIDVYIKGNQEISQEEYRKKMERIEQKLLESNHVFSISVYVISSQEYDSIERYKQRDFLKYCVKAKQPDGDRWYYYYNEFIAEGKVE